MCAASLEGVQQGAGVKVFGAADGGEPLKGFADTAEDPVCVVLQQR